MNDFFKLYILWDNSNDCTSCMSCCSWIQVIPTCNCRQMAWCEIYDNIDKVYILLYDMRSIMRFIDSSLEEEEWQMGNISCHAIILH